MLILIADAFDPSLPQKLAPFGEVTGDVARLPEAEVLLIRSKTKVTRDLIDRAPLLKLVIRGGVGLDNVDRAYAAEKGIEVTNTPEASSVAVAELAFALMLAAPNHIVAGHNGMREGKWLKKELKRTELLGKTLGLLGVGRIGTEVARRATAFGMTVIAHDPYLKQSDVAELLPLSDVLARSDYLSLHTPLTPETEGMLGAAALLQTKPGVIIVNTGRAKVVDAGAMADALERGHVACYATDVWPKDPPSDDYPLLKAPRVLMAPHIGASSRENLLRIGEIVEAKIKAHVGK